MNVLIILNFLTAIVAFVVLFCKRHFLFALVALFCVGLYGYGIWHAGIHVDDEICRDTSNFCVSVHLNPEATREFTKRFSFDLDSLGVLKHAGR